MFAVMMVTAAGPALAANGDSARVSPYAESVVTWSGYDIPDDVVRYGSGSHPGVFVNVETTEDVTSLNQWVNASEDRQVIQRYDGTKTVLISAPMTDVTHPFASLARWTPGGESAISDLGYVTGWSLDRSVEYADPITGLESSDAFQKPAGSFAASAFTSGEYSADAMAWSEDANTTTLAETRGLVGADSVQASGEGVNVAVIDSGVNFGNGTLYGNGTEGSDIRVADAYDYVEGEEPNLSVSRSELPTELEKVSDPNGHGSWVSSAVVGADGIAPNATLMAYRALDGEGSGSTSDIKAAIARADAQGADILVMSLGSPIYSDAMASELKHALSEDGNVTGAFIAVGNSYTTTRYVSSPADVENVIGVTATNGVNASAAQKAYFANIGPDHGVDKSGGRTHGVKPDTAAPGMQMRAPVFTEDGRLVNRTLSGTSMSAPIAAGVGVLLLDAEPSLKGQPTEFRDRIVNSGSHTPHLGVTESLGGMVNASRAIDGYSGADAPDRDLPDDTEGRDAANQFLTGDFGLKMAEISRFTSGAV
jgi:subtilisin family serine protease